MIGRQTGGADERHRRKPERALRLGEFQPRLLIEALAGDIGTIPQRARNQRLDVGRRRFGEAFVAQLVGRRGPLHAQRRGQPRVRRLHVVAGLHQEEPDFAQIDASEAEIERRLEPAGRRWRTGAPPRAHTAPGPVLRDGERGR